MIKISKKSVWNLTMGLNNYDTEKKVVTSNKVGYKLAFKLMEEVIAHGKDSTCLKISAAISPLFQTPKEAITWWLEKRDNDEFWKAETSSMGFNRWWDRTYAEIYEVTHVVESLDRLQCISTIDTHQLKLMSDLLQ